MKTMKLFSMAAAALLMAACSNSDDFDVQKPAETAGVYHFEATIAAPDADATMRTVYTEVTESSDPDYKKIKVAWKKDDEIALVHNGVVDVAKVTAVDASGKATIEATITGNPSNNTVVYLAYPADAVANATTPYPPFPFTPSLDIFNKVRSQDGTLKYIQDNLDLRMGLGHLVVSGDKVTLKKSVSIPSLICIWKLTLQDNAATPSDLNATQLTFINNNSIQARATSTGKSEYYLCVVPRFNSDASGTFSFEATVGSDTYTFSTTGLSLTDGKYYQSTLKMAKPTDLSTISAAYEAKNGETLTGTLGSDVKISIAAGATVVLKNVTINGTNNSSYKWAGLTPLGDATIILEGTNSVKGFYEDYPGIFAAVGKTLTIMGSGNLTASSNGTGAAGIGGGEDVACGNIVISGGTITATGGIGGGEDGACGNIVISGGTITATGGENAAGIGSGQSYDGNASCGNITISGGTITATGGGGAAGIGSGQGYTTSGVDRPSTCGAITITSGVTKVTATKGSDATNSIGSGKKSTCGSVTIDGIEYWDGSAYKNGGNTYLTTSPLVYSAP